MASPVVTKPPRVRGTAQEYFEPCLPGDAPAFTYPDSCHASLTVLPPEPQIGVMPMPEVQTCPRPRSPTPKKPSPPPRRPSPEYVRPPRRLSTVSPFYYHSSEGLSLLYPFQVSPSPPRRMTPTPTLPARRTSKIKFSTSTALYTPAKPVYEAHKRRESSSKLASEQLYTPTKMEPYDPHKRSQNVLKTTIPFYSPTEAHRRRQSGPGLPIHRLPGSFRDH